MRAGTWLVLGAAVSLAVGCEKAPDAAKNEPAKVAASSTTSADKPAKTTPTSPLAKVEPAKPKPSEKTSAQKAASRVMLGSPELTDGIPGEGNLTKEQVQAWLDDPKNHEPLDFDLPLGLSAGRSQVKGIDKNPLTRAKIELGRQLYFDPRLSSDETISCASCHDPAKGFAARSQFGIGVSGQMGGRNSPVSYNRILSDEQFWDGRADSLEAQAVGPIANPIEMGNTHEACVICIEAIPLYKMQFAKIFGEDQKMTIDHVGQAIAAFERAIVTGPSPYDYYEGLQAFTKGGVDPEELKTDDPEAYTIYQQAKADAEAHPMSDSAVRGYKIFFSDKGRCSTCHVGPNLSDEKYHNLGIGMAAETPDLGRYEVSKDDKDRGAFKTPTIRNVTESSPYMHDGGLKTLEEVIEWYDKGGHPNEHLSDKVVKLNLTADEKKDLLAFLQACTGDFPTVESGRLPPE